MSIIFQRLDTGEFLMAMGKDSLSWTKEFPDAMAVTGMKAVRKVMYFLKENSVKVEAIKYYGKENETVVMES